MKIPDEAMELLKNGKSAHCHGVMLVPIEHDPHECREDGFHPARIGAKKAPDGKWYVPDSEREGKWLRIRH